MRSSSYRLYLNCNFIPFSDFWPQQRAADSLGSFPSSSFLFCTQWLHLWNSQSWAEHMKQVKAERVHLRMIDCSGVAICKKRLQLSESFLWGNKQILITHTCSSSFVCYDSNTLMHKWAGKDTSLCGILDIRTAFKYRVNPLKLLTCLYISEYLQ